ncbi:MAG: hypothetical protein IJV75_00180 [Alphaproteobacteria bacterium]|nr:hypothetical protein [Alphaproteobacteria bacterium]
MINDIINGISVKLNEVFGSEHQIYKENIKQGLKEPCFNIVALEPTQTARLPNRYFRTYPFDIHYFPKSKTDAKTEMYEVAERLFIILEYIFVVDNLCKGNKMKFEIVDGVLHFFVNYDTFIKKPTVKTDHMSDLMVDSTLEV